MANLIYITLYYYSEKILMVARESGLVQRYALPNIALTNKYQINTKAHKLALNCNST